jgi:hypothetical protein
MGGVWDAKRGVWSVGYVDGFLGETQGVFRSASHIWFCFLDVMMLELHLSMRIISQFLNFHVIFHILTEKKPKHRMQKRHDPGRRLEWHSRRDDFLRLKGSYLFMPWGKLR